ncbi:MAG: two-component system regulatory protein YycI [Streptococcaceae bacterium]|jgi:regulatory protein YycI of two-component signal transduction system YycFG|nr:two-component system regulatory protein YycI [Streptococcaceae bacterium]
MDFKNIQNIFIAVFVILNFFLFSIYQENRAKYGSVSNQIKSNIEYRLEKDDIEVDTLSTKHQKGYYLSAEKKELVTEFKNLDVKNIVESSNGEIKATPTNVIYLDKKVDDAAIKQLLKKSTSIYNASEYSYLSSFSYYDKKEGEIVLSQSYKSLPFLDENSRTVLDLTVTDNLYKFTLISQNYLINIKPLREAEDLISEREAIIALYNNLRIPEKSKILSLQLGYTRIIELNRENVYVPTWFVKVQSEVKSNKTTQIEKVNALNSNIITETTVTKINESE